MNNDTTPIGAFSETGLNPAILEALARVKFTEPTPIQAQAIPVALQGSDLIGIAQTGTGKTMAFALPIIEKMWNFPNSRALIIAPTRELALQIEESIKTVLRAMPQGLRTISLIGGVPIYRQIKELKSAPRVIIATPGRLQDHLNQRTISLQNVQTLVLDEADRMLDMGFAPQIKLILQSVPSERQTMLFSATMPSEIRAIVDQYMKEPQRIEVDSSANGEVNANIQQELCYVKPTGKPEVLASLLQKHDGKVLVFTRTKHGASKLSKHVYTLGHTAAEIHSNRSLVQRKQALEGFRNGRYRVLVATDVAARGLDVKDIEIVINYDLPDACEDYVHRIGRTGRAGKMGLAISMATHDQVGAVRTIERITKQTISLSEYSDDPPARFSSYGNRSQGTRSQSGRSQSGRRRTSGYQGGFRGRSENTTSSAPRGGYQGRSASTRRFR